MANSALGNAEWKAATILGGAAIEAPLHWKLNAPQTAASGLAAGTTNAVCSCRLQRVPPTNFNQWRLVDFIAVAGELEVPEEATFKQADTACNYRNLIHPGQAARQQKYQFVWPTQGRRYACVSHHLGQDDDSGIVVRG